MLVGKHITNHPDHLFDSLKWIIDHKCNLIQLFIDVFHNNKSLIDKFNNFVKKNDVTVIVHSSYTINLSKSNDTRDSNIQHLIYEISIAHAINAKYIVLHMGKKLDLELSQAYNNMFMNLVYVVNSTKNTPVKILLETPAGQGTELCFKLEDFSYFFKKISKNKNIIQRFGICIDTCHIFAAGYDISTLSGVRLYFEAFEELIGIKYINLIHLNDSKNKVGSCVDRHECIGKGCIKEKMLLLLAFKFYSLNVPIILETSSDIDDLALVVNYIKRKTKIKKN